MTFALIRNGSVFELFEADPKLGAPFDIRDVSAVVGVAPGWTANADGSFSAQAAPPPPSAAQLAAYAAAALAALMAKGSTFNVAAEGAAALPILCDGTSATRADLGLFALFGQQSPTATKTWVDNNGVATTLTGAELVSLATLAGTWIDDGYATLGQVLAGIASTPPAVTTTAQIDQAFAAAD